jgi:hypothetical protein
MLLADRNAWPLVTISFGADQIASPTGLRPLLTGCGATVEIGDLTKLVQV